MTNPRNKDSSYVPDMETINIDELTESQQFIMQQFAFLVKNVLSLTEIAVTDDRKMVPLKHLLNRHMYDCRNNMLQKFGDR